MRPLLAALAALLVAAPASVGADGARPPVALTASPAHVLLQAPGRASVRVANAGSQRVVVDVRRAGFALDLRGRPKIVAVRRSRRANAWVTVRPRSFVLRPGRSASLRLAARPPRGAGPGDHAALVLLTTRRVLRGRVAVRMRLGVVVDVRVPGKIVHGLALRGLHVRRLAKRRALELLVANRGNVTEELGRERLTLSLTRGGRPLARLRPEPRQLLPRTRGLVIFRYGGRASGVVSALVRLTSDGGAVTYRVFRLRL